MYNPAEYRERVCPHSQEYHFRGYLPHLELKPIQVVTFRLADSVPKEVIDQWKLKIETGEITKQSDKNMARLRKLVDQYEDAGYGDCYLKDECIAKLVEDTLFYYEGRHYQLVRWCIMPNHVHVMVEPKNTYSLSTILKEWKSYTAQIGRAHV